MAAKRSASAQLTSDNWEQEDENDEPTRTGFTKASAEELERRPMKTARRTLAAGSSGEAAKSGGKLFSAIDLMGGLKPFGLSSSKPLLPSSSSQPFLPSIAPFPFTAQNDTHSKYIKKLCALNESVSQWISDHVKKNPCVDLTPIFEDYKKYLKELDSEKEGTDVVAGTVAGETVATETGSDEKKVMENGKGEMEAATDEEEREDGEEQDDTGKKQLNIVQETEDDSDCLLALRSKLYYKKEGKFVELGVGKLRVEEMEGGEGVKLLLRNDTTLKQILLNIRINSQVPMTLQKNSLLIVCPPNPPLETKSPSKSDESPGKTTPLPVTYAIRVKDGHVAEQLHSTIKNNIQ